MSVFAPRPRLLLEKVSQSAAESGSKSRKIRCTHWIASKKRHDASVQEEAALRHPGDVQRQAEFARLNRFKGDGACQFVALGSLNRTTKRVTVSMKSNLHHSPFCPVTEMKAKRRSLLRDPIFRDKVQGMGGRATFKALGSTLGSTADPDVVMAAQRRLREIENQAFDAMFREMPTVLTKLHTINPGMHLQLDVNLNTKAFVCAFVSFGQAAEALRLCGRPVCSTDFGHSKHDLFDGVAAVGVFQLGDGRLLPLWAAVFAGRETNEAWKWCADCIVEAGIGDLFEGVTHFRDRHPGAEHFEQILGVAHPAFCTVHIIRNIRETKHLEKGFHDNMVWRLQASENEEDFAKNLAAFETNFPKVRAYISKIDPRRWVRFGLHMTGASTFGWRSNNGGEIGQGSLSKDLRACHPLSFLTGMFIKVAEVLATSAADHAAWRAQEQHQVLLDMVPHGIKLFSTRAEVASKCNVRVTGPSQGIVRAPGAQSQDHVVQLGEGASCSCLDFQESLFPCHHQLALGLKLGTASNLLVATLADKSFKICDIELAQISATVTLNVHVLLKIVVPHLLFIYIYKAIDREK